MTTAPHASARSAADLADSLVEFVCQQIEDLAEKHAPSLALPRVFAGHAVGPDTRSDLAHTLGLLFEAGVEELAGMSLEAVVLETLRGLEGEATHTFYSYRASESLLRFGGFQDNPRLAAWSTGERDNLATAIDSSDAATGLGDGRLPINYAVVIARCEFARQRLGLLVDDSLLEQLVARCRELFAAARDGWIDDSNERRGQFDIYTPDMFLFAEPISHLIGSDWQDGLRRVLNDVDDLALPGGAIVWGRSIGALGLAMSIELAALGAARDLSPRIGAWLARADSTLAELRAWFSDGVIRAHQRRSTMFYRGPARRLQMTLDVLGKLVQAALELRRAPELPIGSLRDAWRAVDRVVRFDSNGAGAWAYRDARLSFVLPMVGGWSSDYLAAPRAPGLFETPVGGPVCLVPVVHRGGKKLVSAGVPLRVEHVPRGLDFEIAGFDEVGAGPAQPPPLAGTRRTRMRVEGRTLIADEELHFDSKAGLPDDLDAIAFQIPALASRPLDVCFESEQTHRVNRIDVDGMAEFRSFWSEIETVHQLDLDPAESLRFRWSVTPQLRVASTARSHPYDSALYDPLEGRLVPSAARAEILHDDAALLATDVLHMHWPEWWMGVDPDRNRRALARLRDASVRILWTQHNLVPHHFRGEDAETCYRLWAEAADAVIHHTEWGRAEALARYDYRPDVLHRVIHHGDWSDRVKLHAGVERERVERELGLAPCAIRLGVVGAPRAEKDVQLVLDAFHACSREDMQLLVVCQRDEQVPDDPRILALPNRHEPEHVYYQRLRAIDVLVFPFAPSGMLMTGTALDAMAAEKAALTSDWPLLAEVFGSAAIPYGATRADLTARLEALSKEQVAASAAAMRERQAEHRWSDIAEQTFQLLEEMAAR